MKSISEEAGKARSLVASALSGMRSTVESAQDYPYGSIVDLLPLDGADVVLLLSTLAVHQKQLAASPKASLLIAPFFSETNPLAHPRVTLQGRVNSEADKNLRLP